VNLLRSHLRSHLLHRIVVLLLVLPAAGALAQDAALPAFKEVDENVHILKLDVSHEFDGLFAEDNFRAEFHDLKTRRHNALSITEGQLAVGWEAHPEDIAPFIHAHPTQSEALGEAFLALAGKPLHTL